MAMLRACCCLVDLSVQIRKVGRLCEVGFGEHTRKAPIKPKTLKIFAKCRYRPKLLARWYGSSGNWWKSSEERVLLVKVAIATTIVTVLYPVSSSVEEFPKHTTHWNEEKMNWNKPRFWKPHGCIKMPPTLSAWRRICEIALIMYPTFPVSCPRYKNGCPSQCKVQNEATLPIPTIK